MSTQFTNRQWRLPNNENKDKQSNYSMDFDGTQSVDVGTVTINNSGSFSIWFKISNIAYYQNILGSSNASGMFKYITLRNGILYQYVLGTGWIVLYSTSLDDNEWHNLIFTYDSTTSGGPARGTFKSYVDGVLTKTYDMINDVSEDWSSSTLTSIAYFGTTQPFGPRYFDGKIDGVSVFNYALTDGTGGTVNQIATLYGSSSTGIGNPMSLSPKPVAMYNLGDQDAFNGSSYLTPNASLKDFVFNFDSSNSNYIDCGNDSGLDITGTLSISFWIYGQTNATHNGVITKTPSTTSISSDAQYHIQFQSSNQLRFVVTGCDLKAGTETTGTVPTVDVDSWQHYTMTWNGSNEMIVYKNGVEVATKTQSTTIVSNTSDLTIGHRLGYGYLDGKLSNIQFFNTALPATGSNSVETLYNNGSPLTSMSGFTSLQGWWKLDASEVYNSSTTEWEINDSTATELKAFAFDLKQGSSSTDNELVATYPNNELNGLSSITVSGWLYANDNIARYDGIYSNRSGSSYFLFHANTITSTEYSVYVQGANSSTWAAASSTTIRKNTWNHIALVCESSSIKIYINGVDATSSSTNNFPGITQTVPFDIGSDGTSRNFDGLMSNFQVWNTNLSDSQVLSLYNNGKPIQTLNDIPQNSNLIGWWQLNDTATFDGTNWNIPDDSGNNNTGVSSNMTQDNLVDTNVSALNGLSSGMSQANLVQSDLSFTSGYSPYALDFDAASSDYIDCGNVPELNGVTQISFSIWFNNQTPSNNKGLIGDMQAINFSPALGRFHLIVRNVSSNDYSFRLYIIGSDSAIHSIDIDNRPFTSNEWYNLVVVYNAGLVNFYVDGSLAPSTITAGAPIPTSFVALTYPPNKPLQIGRWSNLYFDGKISNASIWNTALTSTQVSEIYNEGVPSNLNNHSAYSNLVSWWQLGSNSSFNTNWTVLDEKGSNNGTSVNMDEDAIVDGVGSYANGLSSGMGGDEVIGDAPYSSSNSLSVNMDVLDRTEDTPA